jgi:YbbR domain-containing protein
MTPRDHERRHERQLEHRVEHPDKPVIWQWIVLAWQAATRNFIWKALSLAIAIAAWLAVASEPELATIVAVPVEYRNYPKDLEISSDIVSTINVEARGPASRLASLHDSRIAAVIDLAGVNVPGERTFTLSASALNLPRGADLIRTIPSQLHFTFEQRLTRMLPVDVPLSGQLPKGLAIDAIEVEPQELRVAGPQTHVLKAGKLVSDPFDISRLKGTTQQTVVVYANDPEVRLLSKPQVTVKIRVRPSR